MDFNDFKDRIIELGVSIVPWEDCQVFEEKYSRGRSVVISRGNCTIGGVQRDVEFMTRHIKLSRTLRSRKAKAAFDEMKRDILLMSRLSQHLYVIRLYGVVFKEMSPVMIFESGIDDLQHYLESQADMDARVKWPEKLRLCHDIVKGVQALHSINVVHGNLMAENVVLCKSQENDILVAKVTGFESGFAFSSDGGNAETSAVFLAPERMYTFRSKYSFLQQWERSPSQDIFGVGLTIWQVAMDGERPYLEAARKRMRLAEIEEMRLKDVNLDMLMDRLPSDIDPALVSVIRRATKRNPTERADLDDIGSSLEELLCLETISFEETTEQIGSDVSHWTRVNVMAKVGISAENRTAFNEWDKFANSASYNDSLPSSISTKSQDLQHWIFQQCQENVSYSYSGHSQFLAACCYHWGVGVEKDRGKAFERLTLAAACSDPEGECMLGEFYRSGLNVRADATKAFGLFSRSADGGNPRANFLLGQCYYDGEGVGKDRKKALTLWNKAADAGVIAALNRVNELQRWWSWWKFKRR